MGARLRCEAPPQEKSEIYMDPRQQFRGHRPATLNGHNVARTDLHLAGRSGAGTDEHELRRNPEEGQRFHGCNAQPYSLDSTNKIEYGCQQSRISSVVNEYDPMRNCLQANRNVYACYRVGF
jgi:hypothetical protein